MMPRTRLEWVEKLAGAGMWIAIGASVFLAATRPEWMWALSGCIIALAVVIAVAGIPRRRAGRRWLAEAESLLAEVDAARRAAALRSYLQSAPRLAVMMWARQLLRRLRPGPRRPG